MMHYKNSTPRYKGLSLKHVYVPHPGDSEEE
jgi:hypothetical protein